MPKLIRDELSRMRKEKLSQVYTAVTPDWKKQLPEGSQWFPGSQGDPACNVCHGLGWLRKELSQYDKNFGKLVLCNCVPRADHIALEMENEKIYGRSNRD